MRDLKQLGEDAERVEKSRQPKYLSELESDKFSDSATRLAAFVRDLTDPTPLTVEGLVEAGAIVVGNYYWFGCIHAFHSGGNRFDWYIGNGDLLHYPPRTVGELRQLLLRMQEKS